jgi:Tfp pilus assembly protein PilO
MKMGINLNLNPAALNKHKNIILNIGVIIIFLIIANGIYKDQSLTLANLERSREVEMKKNAALGNISVLEKKISLYRDFLNKKDLASMINNISNIARESEIRIISIRPQNEKDQGDYIKYPFVLSIAAQNYHKLGQFIARLESSPDVYIIESISVRPFVGGAQQAKEAERVYGDITLVTILLK